MLYPSIRGAEAGKVKDIELEGHKIHMVQGYDPRYFLRYNIYRNDYHRAVLKKPLRGYTRHAVPGSIR
jgi:hypothetical protein